MPQGFFNFFFCFSFVEKLCKSNIDTWGCYGECSSEHEEPKTPQKCNNTSSTSNDEECCSASKKRKSFSRLISTSPTTTSPNAADESSKRRQTWRPLLMFIPLRLGLSDTNPAYFSSLKVCPYMITGNEFSEGGRGVKFHSVHSVRQICTV